MAVMIPGKPFETNSYGEKDLFKNFKVNLPNDYYVLHSLRWIGGEKKVEGEVDFLILHPTKGILLLEIKGGIIRYENRLLIQENSVTGETKEIDPIGQLRASKHKLIDSLNKILPRGQFCMIGYAVWFPSYPLTGSLPEDMLSDFTADSTFNESPNDFIENAYAYWLNKYKTCLDENGFNKILQWLCGEFSIAPSLRSDYEYREDQFIRLTNEQAKILDFLEDQDQAVITGIAGTGKTLIAMERCKRLALNKENVLYLCFNNLLASYLKSRISFPYLTIKTFHSLAQDYFSGTTYRNLEELESKFVEMLILSNFDFDYSHIVIDEGQDFKAEWIEALQIRQPRSFYIFCDPYQNLYRDSMPEWFVNASCRLTLTKNCRNNKQIAKASLKLLNHPSDKYVKDSIAGEKPFYVELKNVNDAYSYIKKTVNNHLHNVGGKYEDIVILTLNTVEKTCLKELGKTKLPLSSSIENGKVTFTTARKFKGLEGKIVIIADVDLSKFNDISWKTLFYVAFSRGMHEVHVLLIDPEENIYKQILEQEFKDRTKLIKNKSKFESLFQIQFREFLQ